jgi:alpha-tubulin suppressor-like RCC1 family protein
MTEKRRWLSAMAILPILLFGFASCNLSGAANAAGAPENTARVSLVLPAPSASRTILPAIPSVSAYRVTVSGGPTAITPFQRNALPIEITVLYGTYQILVEALDSTGSAVAAGTASFSASAAFLSVEIVLEPILPEGNGDGAVALTVHIPYRARAEAISLSLTPIGGGIMEIPLAIDHYTASYGATMPSGDYIMRIRLYRGGTCIGGRTEALRIAERCSTSAVIDLDAKDVDLVQAALGYGHSEVLRADGTIWACGEYDIGSANMWPMDFSQGDYRLLKPVDPSSFWIAIASGAAFTIALRSDGTLWSWGGNTNGQLGRGNTELSFQMAQVGQDANWLAISAGGSHVVALRRDGSLWAWGDNGSGQLGDGSKSVRYAPIRIGTDSDWAAISAGQSYTVALKEDGSLWTWGDNAYGQLGDGTIAERLSPSRIGSDDSWMAVDAGDLHVLALKDDGSLWAWGRNDVGQLGDGSTEDCHAPESIASGYSWTAVAAGGGYDSMYNPTRASFALRSDGTLWGWGSAAFGSDFSYAFGNQTTPKQIVPGSDWLTVEAGHTTAAALKKNGELWIWGSNEYGQMGNGHDGIERYPIRVGNGEDWKDVEAAELFTVALKEDGTLWSWGDHTEGRLGTGTGLPSSSPVQVGSSTAWTAISAKAIHVLALRNDGTLWAWGWNSYGQVGNGTYENQLVPIQVGSDSDWAKVFTSADFSMALKDDGSLWAWGENSWGQLGIGSTSWEPSPVRVGSYSDWVNLSLGDHFSIGVRGDGSLWAWGAPCPALGLGETSENVLAPTQIGTETTWATTGDASPVVYRSISMAMRNDGSLWAWGSDSNGLFRTGSQHNESNVPMLAGSGEGWIGLSTGSYSVVAVKQGGSLWSWGHVYIPGNFGLSLIYAPMQIGADSDWKDVSVNTFHTMALKTDGTLWTWGSRDYGVLGLGDTVSPQTFGFSVY